MFLHRMPVFYSFNIQYATGNMDAGVGHLYVRISIIKANYKTRLLNYVNHNEVYG